MITNLEKTAQFYDRFLSRVTLGLFLLAIALVLDCTRYFLDGEIAEYLRYARRAMAVGIAVTILPVIYKLFRLRVKNKAACREPESFVVETYQRACVHSFIFVMLLLVILLVVLGPASGDIPTEFFIKALLSAAFFAVSVSFFIQTRGDSDDAFDDIEVEQ